MRPHSTFVFIFRVLALCGLGVSFGVQHGRCAGLPLERSLEGTLVLGLLAALYDRTWEWLELPCFSLYGGFWGRWCPQREMRCSHTQWGSWLALDSLKHCWVVWSKDIIRPDPPLVNCLPEVLSCLSFGTLTSSAWVELPQDVLCYHRLFELGKKDPTLSWNICITTDYKRTETSVSTTKEGVIGKLISVAKFEWTPSFILGNTVVLLVSIFIFSIRILTLFYKRTDYR